MIDLAGSSEYAVHLAVVILLYSMLAQSFNIIFGVGQLFNLAHIASYALGAYATALCSIELGYGFLSCIMASALITLAFSFLVGAISLRLNQDYFAIGTLAFSSLVSSLLINWKSVTRGVLGIPGIPRPFYEAHELIDNSKFLVLVALVCLLTQFLLFICMRNSFARALSAQAQNENVASAIGRNPRLTRLAAFALASCVAGVAGSLFAYYMNFIDPSSFTLSESVLILSIVVVGGPASFRGALIASTFLILVPEAIRFIDVINRRPDILGPMRQLIYAIVLFCVVFIYRSKLFPKERVV